jgi:DNA-binding transcriptional LysR family regulator
MERILVAHGIRRHVVYNVAKTWSIPPIVQRTELIGLVLRKFAEDIADTFELDIHELPFEFPREDVFMLWHVNKENDPGHKWLREQMIQALESN